MGYGRAGGDRGQHRLGPVALTMAGDGDFLMNGQELATASQYGAKSIIVLLNNGMFGTIRMHQEREYPTRVRLPARSWPTPISWAWRRASATRARASRAPEEFRAGAAGGAGAQARHADRVMLDPEVITTRGTLSGITQAALQRPMSARA
jgi:acetolactate synthase-1/2/3 large subunit